MVKPETLLHSQLVALAARWLRREHPIVVTEMTSYALETPDALGFRHNYTTLVECKVSRSDFLADGKKKFRVHPEMGMGNRRFYLCPREVIRPDELPAGWGLLYAMSSGCHVVRHAEQQACDTACESLVLFSALRRMAGSDVQGVSIKVFQIPTKNRASLYLRED